MKNRITAIITFLLLISISVAYSQLLGISPTQGNIGQNLAVTISGNNIFATGINTGGNIYQIFLKKGNDEIYIFDYNWNNNFPNIIDANTVLAGLILNAANTQPGIYDLHVITGDANDPLINQTVYILPGAFTVNAPTGSIAGNVYKDLNRNGIKESGEPNLAGETIRIVPAGSNAFFSVTDASGNYSIPAYNNNYTVSFVPLINDLLYPTTGTGIINFTISNNNSTGNNFGVNGALLSITPDFIEKGTTSVHTITSVRPIFNSTSTPNGNITQFAVLSSPLLSLTPATSVTVIDSFTVQVTINTPTNIADAAAVDLRLYTNSGSIGNHYLRQQLSVISAPSCVAPDSTWAKFITASSFRTNWTPVPGAYRYQVYYKIGGTPTWTQRSVAGSNTFMGIQNLNCGTNYRWKVRTVCQTPSGNIRSVWTPVKVTTTLSCEAEPVDRIAETETVSVDVFPNPASEFIAIEAGADISGQAEFELYNLTGALIMKKSITLQSGETLEVNVNDVPEGLYFIRMNGAVNYTSKILIQH